MDDTTGKEGLGLEMVMEAGGEKETGADQGEEAGAVDDTWTSSSTPSEDLNPSQDEGEEDTAIGHAAEPRGWEAKTFWSTSNP